MMVLALFAASALLSLSAATALPKDFQRRCSELARTFRPNDQTTVLVSEFVPDGTNFTDPDGHPSCQIQPYIRVWADMCRLRLNVTTSSSSSIIMEVWMPVDWNEKGRRFIMQGNSGLGGCIPYLDMAFTAYHGFAAVGHNNGHTGDTGVPFFNRPEVVKDYVYRALSTATKIGKVAVSHFYKKKHKKAYFLGCSSGGRQGLKAAQEFPEEYDGIIAGAPANDLTSLISAYGHYYKIFGKPGDSTFLSEDQWKVVHNFVVSRCDGIDGAHDGVIEDPLTCVPRPETMMCAVGQTWESHQCLSEIQVSSVRKFYEPFYGNGGKLIYPRHNPGGEIWAASFTTAAGKAPPYLEEFFRYALYNNESWSVDSDFNLDAVDYAHKVDLYGVSTWKDLRKLKAAGTKLLMWHGLMDGLISSENSYRYYEHVSRSMRLTSSQLDDFYRYFPIPGMDHCLGGSGAWHIASGPMFWSNATQIEMAGGALDSIVRWVEAGVAPERIIGRNLTEQGVNSIKAHCKWPMQNVYLGGDYKKKESWGCQ